MSDCRYDSGVGQSRGNLRRHLDGSRSYLQHSWDATGQATRALAWMGRTAVNSFRTHTFREALWSTQEQRSGRLPSSPNA